MQKGIFFLAREQFPFVYDEQEKNKIAELVNILDPHPVTVESYRNCDTTWPDVDIIFSSWGMAKMDDLFLSRFPRVKAVFYAAGSVKSFVTDTMWERGIRISSAYTANAVPVCEFTVSQILFSLKMGWQQTGYIRAHKKYPHHFSPHGVYHATVGLLSLGAIGRMVAERLQSFDIHVIAYDPFIKPEEAKRLGVEIVSLDEAFSRSDVVSCHTPWLKETERMIKGRHFALMKQGSTFLNTARGAVVDEAEMIEVLRTRPDLFAVLDVTHPEPPAPDSPLFSLDNVILTPHIAGSLGSERARMGRHMLEELERYLAGEPLLYEITKAKASTMA